MAVKLDLNKAYDRVCWDFLFCVMEKMGFDGKWISWVKQCVCTVKYSIVVNGGQVCEVVPERGLRQGDPLSPYLFLMVADVFSVLMHKAVMNKSIGGVRMKKRCPIVSQLLFADDSLVFLEAAPQSCLNFMELTSAFGKASGLSLNAQKSSVFFSPNTRNDLKDSLKSIMGMKEMEGDSKYLGLPVCWGRSKKASLGYLRDRIMKKAQGWGNLQLNHAGKEVLIKSVAQPIPMYTFMCFKVPKSICSCLDSTLSNFWWGKSSRGRKMHWGAWNKLTMQKSMGGLGFKDFESFNVALLAKQFWRLNTHQNSLWARILKGLYFPSKTCMEAERGSTPSWVWCSLLEGRSLIKEGTQWNVVNGESIQFWDDQWVPGIVGGKVSVLDNHLKEPLKVADFIDPLTKEWNRVKLKKCIPEAEVQAVCKIPISCSSFPDRFIWRHTKTGEYTVKSGYAQRRLNLLKVNPALPSCSFTPSGRMWNKLWSIPTAPKVRMFMWKVVRNWVACRENLFRRKCSPNPTCQICNDASESIEHLLFHCPWSKAVWFGSGKAFWVFHNEIRAVDKWMEDILCGCLSKETSKEVVGDIFQICWAIWKARNNFVFNSRKPVPEEVIEQARKASMDYLQVVCHQRERGLSRPSRLERWSPPPPSAIKFNCDGAFKSSRSLAAFGIIARDCGGSAHVWRCGRTTVSSALSIEAWALRIACKVAIEENYQNVVFESDCKTLISCLTDGKSQCP